LTVALALAVPSFITGALLHLGLAYAPQIAVCLIAALFSALVGLLVKIKNTKARHAALAVADAAKAGVLYVEARVAPALGTGPDAAAKAKGAAIGAALDFLKSHGLGDIKADLGKTDAELEADLGLKVQDHQSGAVAILAAAGPIAPAPAPVLVLK
jgi:hypothetical protein